MSFNDLHVLHWRGALQAQVDASSSPHLTDFFVVDTCQRRVAVALGEGRNAAAFPGFPNDGSVEHFRGSEAYAFLLRFACGLESQLLAETEIFGQVKEAWRRFEALGGPAVRKLNGLIQGLFQDVKTVRAQHLSNVGSASYGSLVRRLLGDRADGPVLLVGAGQLAQSVAPWLDASNLSIWNRSQNRAQDLAGELRGRPGAKVQVVNASQESEMAAWRLAHHVVVCVPGDAKRDQQRIAAWNDGGASRAQGGRIIHLGVHGSDGTAWHAVPGLVTLDDLFEQLRAHSDLRQRALDRARRACRERALLRSMDASASHAHSWEDLAAFACL